MYGTTLLMMQLFLCRRSFMSYSTVEVWFQHISFLLGTWGRDIYFLHATGWYTNNYNLCFNKLTQITFKHLDNSDLNHCKHWCHPESHHFVDLNQSGLNSEPQKGTKNKQTLLGLKKLTPKRRDKGNMFWDQPLKVKRRGWKVRVLTAVGAATLFGIHLWDMVWYMYVRLVDFYGKCR